MGNRGTEDHNQWLTDLVDGNIPPEGMVRGFIRFYVLEGYCTDDVFDDIVLQIGQLCTLADYAVERLRAVLGQVVEGTIRLEADA